MIKTEYIRNLNCNYERVSMEAQTDSRRYQYCMLARGGMKYLLGCSVRNIDGEVYLYYDISSSQNVRQIFSGKKIDREWMKNFFWNMRQLRIELTRFLLDERNIIWSPEHIFQDLEKERFRYMYIPYHGQEGVNEDGFDKMLEFWVESVNYEDDGLVEFVYLAYEQYMSAGEGYLQEQIFKDFERLDTLKNQQPRPRAAEREGNIGVVKNDAADVPAKSGNADGVREGGGKSAKTRLGSMQEAEKENEILSGEEPSEKKGIISFWEGRRRKQEQRNSYREQMRRMVNEYAVCEETDYAGGGVDEPAAAEEFGKTIYIEEKVEVTHKLLTDKGELAVLFSKFPFVLGKRKEDVDFVLSDYTASRVHARFVAEEGEIYIEDLNSTNGTFKNGLRLQPYEKRKLEKDDTLRFGKSIFVYQ